MRILAGAVAVLAAAPIVSLALAASGAAPDLWPFLFQYVLPAALRDTALVLAGVGLLAAGLGTTLAWLVSAYDFPGRRAFEWALLLPLAVPTYVVAFAYLDLLHPVGPLQTAIRALAGVTDPRDLRLPDIRSMLGCIVLLGVVLYPYVFLTVRAMFRMQAGNLFDAARTLGTTRARLFVELALPLARPAIVAGTTLALLEALNDVGATEFLGVRTLTVTVYTTWITRSDLAGAAQLSLAMLGVVITIVALEAWLRGARRFTNDARQATPFVRERLTGWRAGAALAAASVPLLLGFLVPAAHLAYQAAIRVDDFGFSPALRDAAVATLTVAAAATALTVAAALVVSYAARLSVLDSSGAGRRLGALVSRAASLGYAVPGTVLAIGVLPIVSMADQGLDRSLQAMVGVGSPVFLLATTTALLYAYPARFLAVATGSLDAGFTRISRSLDDAARSMGDGALLRLWRLHLPLLRPALAAAAMLVFVDAVKELPATLLLRPVGMETLATQLYGEAVRGTYEDGAVAALLIVAVGLIPVIVLARMAEQSFHKSFRL
jgi:iron(III) transport system permease protein